VTTESPDEYPDRLPDDSRTDVAVSLGTILASAIPGLGGVVAGVLSEWSAERRYARVREVLEDLALRVANVRSEVSEAYVKSDEFPDLLDQTLRRVAHERHEGKRRLYAAFLAGALTSPGEPYHDQLRLLRTLEELSPEHVRVIRAMLQEPGPAPPGTGGISMKGITSAGQTLRTRLPDIPKERLVDLVMQLTDELRVLYLGRALDERVVPAKAIDLRNAFTPYGRRLVAYIRAAGESTRPNVSYNKLERS